MCSVLDEQQAATASRRRRHEQLEQEISELAAHLAAATCRWLLLVAEFDERGGWADWGAKTCAHWLSARCSIGLIAAREHVRVARRLRDLPRLREAFGTGELSYCKARALTRVATAETEENLVELARHATGAQLEKLLRGYGSALAATTAAAQRQHAHRHLSVHWEDDGSLRIAGRLAPEEGALVLAALKAAEESAAASEPDDSAETSPAYGDAPARRADALVSISRAALAGAPGGSVHGDPGELVVHVDVASLAGERVHERCELEGGPALAPETARRLGCDGSVVRIVERDGRPLTVGRRKRTIPAALRRALRARDEGCRFPGCTHRRFIHAHHIRHWARGGPTTLENLVHLCSYHHRLVHEGGYSVERTREHGIRFRRPDGSLIAQSRARAQSGGRELERRNRSAGLRIDSETCRPRSAGDRLDYGLAVELLMARALSAT